MALQLTPNFIEQGYIMISNTNLSCYDDGDGAKRAPHPVDNRKRLLRARLDDLGVDEVDLLLRLHVLDVVLHDRRVILEACRGRHRPVSS